MSQKRVVGCISEKCGFSRGERLAGMTHCIARRARLRVICGRDGRAICPLFDGKHTAVSTPGEFTLDSQDYPDEQDFVPHPDLRGLLRIDIWNSDLGIELPGAGDIRCGAGEVALGFFGDGAVAVGGGVVGLAGKALVKVGNGAVEVAFL